MSTIQTSRGLAHPLSTPVHPSSQSSNDAMLRTTGILALMGVALIHFVQIVDTFRSTPSLGVAFVALIAASLAAGLVLARDGSRMAWLSAAVVALAAIVGYVFTRSISTAFDNGDVGNWAETLGMAALFVEGMLLGLSVYAIVAGSPRWSRTNR